MNDNTAIESMGQVYTFFSTASAVGKTCLAINFATELAQQGYKVCLFNADFQFGDICRYLGIKADKNIFDYSNFIASKKNAGNIDLFLAETKYNFSVLAAPLELDEAYLINADLVTQCIGELRDAFDFIVIDTTAGFSDINMGIIEYTDTLFIPTVIDFIPTIRNLKLGLDTLEKLQFNLNRVRLILNRYKAETQISVNDVESLIEKEFQYFVSNDYMQFRQSIKSQTPLVLLDDNKVSHEIKDIVAEELGDGKNDSGLMNWFGKLWKN